MKLRQKGQSLVELVFAIAIAGLVLTGSVILVLNANASQSKKFDHKRASELAMTLLEEQRAKKENDPENFWKLQSYSGKDIWGYLGYTYNIDYAQVTSGGICNTGVNCATVTVTVKWDKDGDSDTDNGLSVVMSRFYSRN